METSNGFWALRVEGVNFAATLFDTNDISTIRGAGLALLEAGDNVNAVLARTNVTKLKKLFAGASQAAFSFQADDDTAEKALDSVRKTLATEPVKEHLMFVADIARLKGEDNVEDGLRDAEALNRARQFREFTVKLPDPLAQSPGPDPLDNTSQGLHDFWIADGSRRLASKSSIDRHNYGRDQRANFYKRGDGAPMNVCRSLQEMVDDPPRGLPVSPRGKLGYLYADGNRFGAIRAKVGTEVFAAELEKLLTLLLRRITAWLRDGLAPHDPNRAVLVNKVEPHARFETLLWGGDEFLFVMPAWLALHFLGEVASAMAGWKIAGHELSFAFGLAICDVKTPVRQARDTAHRLAESVKTAMGLDLRSGAAIQVYESQSLIDAPLATQRGMLFGVAPGATDALDSALTIRAEALLDLPATIRELSGDGARHGGLSGATLHAAITAARAAPGGLLSSDAKDAASESLQRAFGRFGQELPSIDIPGFEQRGLALDLCLIAMLRDYCALPECGAPPKFPALAA